MPEAAAGNGRRREEDGGSMFKTIVQGIGFFLLSQFVVNQLFGSKSGSTGTRGAQNQVVPVYADRADRTAIANYSAIPQQIAPIWPVDSALDIAVYVSPSLVMPALSSLPPETLVLDEKNFTLGDYKDKREVLTSFPVPKEVQNNGTLWAHFYIALQGHQLDPTAKDYDVGSAMHFFRPLNQYLPKKKVRKQKLLLEKNDETEEEEEEPQPSGPHIASYYHPNFTLAAIPDSGVQYWPSIHPALRYHMQLESTGARDASGQNGWYYPTFFLNTFWQLRSHMTELNSTVTRLPLRISLQNLQNWKFSLYASVDEGMKQKQKEAAYGGPVSTGGDGSEFEMVKEILLDTNPYLLTTTGIVSILHMIFETLAFKNDISHWRKKKDVVGTSVRTILANVFMQAVVFLYLMDNSENTSWMILASQGFGILLEAWKITKTVNVRIREPQPGSRFAFLPYHVVFEDKHKLSETEQKTKEYDEIAFRYLYIVAVPLLLAYAVYSLLYETHKSWYSFVIETLVGSVYAYGFLMMVPSLYINYRLKSVAHMPGRAMAYKFLNTFIDDLFAFTIRMPTLHRLATLRDDVIFFIWLYQGWKYKVDYTRVNEFGQGGESDDVDEVKAKGESRALPESKEGKTKDGQVKEELVSASGRDKADSAQKRK